MGGVFSVKDRFFITGGAGFIGLTLARRLRMKGAAVTLFDSFRRSATTQDSLRAEGYEVITGDVCDREGMMASMAGHTHIVHLAAVAGIDTVGRSPTRTIEVDAIGTVNMLAAAQACAKAGDDIKRVVFLSTSEVLGPNCNGLCETDATAIPAASAARWVYAASKVLGEHAAMAYHKEHGLPVVVMRPFNVYGPGQVGEGAIRNFIRAALAGDDITVNGEGGQVRAWCYIDDMAEAMEQGLNRDRAVGEVFNIGNAQASCTISDLAAMVNRICGGRSKIIHGPALKEEVHMRVPDVAKAKKHLNFEATIDLETGIRKTAEWMQHA